MYLLLRVSRMGTYFLELIAWLMVSLESKTFSSWKNELLIFCNKQILLRVERAWSGGRNIYYSEIYKYPYVHSKKSFLSTKSTVKTLKTDHVLPSDVEVAWNIHKMLLLYKYICIFECMSSIGQDVHTMWPQCCGFDFDSRPFVACYPLVFVLSLHPLYS